MTTYYITNAIVGTEAGKPDPANPAGGAQFPSYPLFIAGDTGKIYQSTGQAWVQVAPIGGGASFPGVTGDGQTPGGLNVAGGFVAGDSLAAGVPSAHVLNGTLTVQGGQANLDDADGSLFVGLAGSLTADSAVSAVYLSRAGVLRNGHQFTAPAAVSEDSTGSTADIHAFTHDGLVLARVNGAGGVGMFRSAGGAAPQTLPQATIDAITDANAKTAVQALANTLADMGALTLT